MIKKKKKFDLILIDADKEKYIEYFNYSIQLLNKNGLRNKKEFVNHKILDCLGDLYLTGHKIIGKITCSQGGHKLTNQLLRKVFSNKDNYSLFEIKEKNLPHTFLNRNQLKSIA